MDVILYFSITFCWLEVAGGGLLLYWHLGLMRRVETTNMKDLKKISETEG